MIEPLRGGPGARRAMASFHPDWFGAAIGLILDVT